VARTSAVVVAVVGLAAGGALFELSSKTVPGKGPSSEELHTFGVEVDGALRETQASVHARASTLADLPRLAPAVATDAATVKDLTTEELAFRVKAGETIEIGQVFKQGGRVEMLLRIPDGAKMTAPLDQPGVHVMRAGDQLMVAEVVQITPTQRADELTGALAVAQVVDVQKLVGRLDTAGVHVSARVGDVSVVEGSVGKVAGADVVDTSMDSVGGKLTVSAEILPATHTRSAGMLIGGLVLAIGGLVGAYVVARRRTPALAGGDAGAQVVMTPGPGGTPPRVSRAQDVPPEAAQIGKAKTEVSDGGGGSGPPRPSQALVTQAASPGHFGRYTLVKTIGAGGMAEVYLARISGEAGFEKLFALKIMHRNLSTDPKVVDLFLDEARLVSRLNHPNIVQITDLGKSGDDYFIAMEYIDGWDVDRLVKTARARGQQVPLRVGLTILMKICDGLHAAHTAVGADGHPLDLVHRDVKAENVLVSRAGAVKVGDFGIAKANQQVHKTQLGELKGTAAYMAPEHRTGQEVDRRADVYGVGAIAYEVLTGQEVNLDLAMLAHLGRQGWPHLKPPSEVRPDLPKELDAIVFKALAYDKADRYASCAALEEALEGVCTRYGLTASDKVVAQWVGEVVSAAEAAAPAAKTPTPGQGVA
jgi:serine/threonine-protein kinase